jgi:hypothetical protein
MCPLMSQLLSLKDELIFDRVGGGGGGGVEERTPFDGSGQPGRVKNLWLR